MATCHPHRGSSLWAGNSNTAAPWSFPKLAYLQICEGPVEWTHTGTQCSTPAVRSAGHQRRLPNLGRRPQIRLQGETRHQSQIAKLRPIRLQQTFLRLSLLFNATQKSISRRGSRPSPLPAHTRRSAGRSHRPATPVSGLQGTAASLLRARPAGRTHGHGGPGHPRRAAAHAALPYVGHAVGSFPLSSRYPPASCRAHHSQPGQPRPAR